MTGRTLTYRHDPVTDDSYPNDEGLEADYHDWLAEQEGLRRCDDCGAMFSPEETPVPDPAFCPMCSFDEDGESSFYDGIPATQVQIDAMKALAWTS